MKFRPCIDLHKGKVKQIVGSTFSDGDEKALKINFVSEQSPAYFAQLYKNDNLSGGHVIMLGLGNAVVAKEALSAFPQGLQIGGGINPDNAKEFLDAGASHVIVTSFVFKDSIIYWDNLEKISKKVGRSRLVLDLSCRRKDDDYCIVTDRWQKWTNTIISEENLNHLSEYCNEFLVHAVDIEGKQRGVDTNLVSFLSKWSPIPTTYAGGIRSLDDLELIKTEGEGKIDATIGSALDIFGGTLKYRDIIAWFEEQKG